MKRSWQNLHTFLQPNKTSAYQVGAFPSQAAVLVLFTDDPHHPEMVFTQRARHLKNHPGEVSFPGGMWELGDKSLRDTALRETEEEIGLAPAQVKLLGACARRATGAGIQVTPFVGVMPTATELTPNLGELDAIFRVPIAAFHGGGIQTRTDFFAHGGRSYHVPAYLHQGYEIWGFTAALTTEIITALINPHSQPVFPQ